MLMRSQFAGLLCFTTLSLLTMGCGSGKSQGNSGPNAKSPDGIVQIKGILTIDGKPTEGVKVVLIDPELLKKVVAANGIPAGPNAITDANGAFEISSVKKGDGALPGKYKVYFEWFPAGTASYFDDVTIPIPPAISSKFPPGVMGFFKKYKPGGPGNIDFTIEEKTPQTAVKFDLTTK